MKRFLTILPAALLLLSPAACGAGDGYKVWNAGYGGDSSWAIGARQGAYKLTTKDAITFADGKSTVVIGHRRTGIGLMLATGTDTSLINSGHVPASLRYGNAADQVHLNRYGYHYMATVVYEQGKTLGYWQ